MSRYFFALWPDDKTRDQLAAIGERLPENIGRRVPKQKLHITLSFLGDLDDHHVAGLKTAVTGIRGLGFSLRLDRIGWWKRPKIIWLAPQHIPIAMLQLVGEVNTLVQASGIPLEERPYRPHLTLVRKASKPPRPFKMDPNYWNISDFCLVKSDTLSQGAEYTVLQSWPLSPVQPPD
ncbi:MAG: RNA 2',3'-cyclic phosphodiesterase [Gammaproteobacteria bacterium]